MPHKQLPAKQQAVRGVVAKVVRSSGVVARNPGEGFKVVTDYVANKIEGNAKASIMNGLEYLNRKGSIRDDFLESPENRFFSLQVQADINIHARDEAKLSHKIELFLAIASGEMPGNELERRRIWQLVDNLSESELGILAACKRLSNNVSTEGPFNRKDLREWKDLIAKESGLNHEAFVTEAEASLQNKSLLEAADGLGQVFLEPNYRLTPLGRLITEYLEKGHQILKESAK